MKFPISISNKKPIINKMDTTETNEKNFSQEEDSQTIKDSDMLSHQNSQPESMTNEDEFSNAVNEPANDKPCFGNNIDSNSLENIDLDSKLFGTFKRVSLDRSVSWDDSGFNSCTSDDRDDSDRLSLDLNFLGDEEEESTVAAKQIPFYRLRQRSHSLDSESSDHSEAHFLTSKALSYTTYSDLEKNFVLWRDSNSKLFDEDSNRSLVKNLVKRSKRSKSESIRELKDTSDILTLTSKPVLVRRKRLIKDQNKNSNQNKYGVKNLRPTQKQSSLRMYSCVQEHGLFSILSCLVYTLVLGFIVGICGLLFQAVKIFLSKEDLQDLKASVIQSRQSEKKSSLVKEKKNVLAHRRKICPS